MKFTYQYKTSDGVRHSGEYVARSRTAVYDELRAKGIKAFGVEPAPGFINGISRLFGWRVVSILFLAVISTVATVGYFRLKSEIPAVEDSVIFAPMRRQIIGDTAIIEDGIKNGWSEVFPEEGERFLASFAIPGVPAGVKTTNVEELEKALTRKIAIAQEDSMEAKQIKAMVEGMKEEARRYIAAGGSPVGYGKRLVERQEAEIAIYNRVKGEIERIRKTMAEDAFETYLEERNDELRNLGIKPIVDSRD